MLTPSALPLRAQTEKIGYVVIVNPGNPINKLTRAELSAIFLKKKPVWQWGEPVEPVDQPATAYVRVAFTRDVHRRTVGAIRSYWNQVIFAGRGTPPIEQPTDREVIAYVRANPNAIGYVPPDVPLDGVKALRVE